VNKTNILNFCCAAEDVLKNSSDFAEIFIPLKMEFFKKYQNNTVFSTRFGADFFKEVRINVVNNTPIKPEKDQKLGEYDINFNNWLKTLK